MIRRIAPVVGAITLLVLAGAGLWRAAIPPPTPREAQVEAVAATLRCPSCQGLSAAESPSAIAKSMRAIIASQLADGRTPDEVRAWFVARYGSWILLSPMGSLGWLLWLWPLATIAIGTAWVLRASRRSSSAASERSEVVALDRAAGAGSARERQRETTSTEPSQARPIRIRRAPEPSRRVAAVALLAMLTALAASVAPQGSSGLFAVDSQAPEPSASTAEIRRLRDAVARQPHDLDTRLAFAAALDAAGHLEDAVESYRWVLAARPRDSRVRLALAADLLQLGRLDEVREEVSTLLNAEPNNPDALLVLGIAQTIQGDPAAPDSLRRFVTAAPVGHRGVAVAVRILRSLDNSLGEGS